MTKEKEQGKRLADILRSLDLSQKKFSELTGIQQSYISVAIKGEVRGISAGMIESMLRVFPHININRIFTGLGPVLFSSEAIQTVEESQAPYGDPLSEARQHLKSALDLLDHCQKMPDDKEK